MGKDTPFTEREFKSVGTRPVRPDGVDKVTGRARYGADYNMPGQLVGLILRSPHAHATIKKIDTSKAEQLPGVKAVITAKDFKNFKKLDGELQEILDNSMARKKAWYDGHAVAAVAAHLPSHPTLHHVRNLVMAMSVPALTRQMSLSNETSALASHIRAISNHTPALRASARTVQAICGCALRGTLCFASSLAVKRISGSSR